MRNSQADIAILGGGLAGGLIALALAERQPELDVVLIEQDEALGGNHVWSFFGPDVAKADRWLLERLVVKGGKATTSPSPRTTAPCPRRITASPPNGWTTSCARPCHRARS